MPGSGLNQLFGVASPQSSARQGLELGKATHPVSNATKARWLAGHHIGVTVQSKFKAACHKLGFGRL